MVSRGSRRIVFCNHLLFIALALTGCGKGSSHSPPKQQVQDAIAAALPPTLSLASVELEPISTGPESAKINFKAVVAPKEDLCQVDREVEGTPKITLLKVVQAAGTKVSLYGCVEARRTMDLWTLDSPQIQTGLEQLGKPKGSFHSQAFITGSSEAAAAIRQQAANAEAERQAKEARLRQEEIERAATEEREAREEKARKERQERERLALAEQQRKMAEQRKKEEEQRKEEEEAFHQKLLLVTAPGTGYIGTATRHPGKENQEVARFRLVFTEQNGSLVSAEASNPDDAEAKRSFTGEIRPQQQAEKDSGETWHIVMSPVGPNAKSGGGIYNFWCQSLKFRLTDKGLEGVAKIQSFDEDRIIRLQPGTAGTAKPKKNATPRVRPNR